MGKRTMLFHFGGGSKRHRRRAAALAQKRFEATMQLRKDLIALTFSTEGTLHEAVRRLKRQWSTQVCWMVIEGPKRSLMEEPEKRLIVGRDQLPLFRGMKYRKARIITRTHLIARSNRYLARHRQVTLHHASAPALERIWDHILTTKFFLVSVYRKAQITYLHAVLWAKAHHPRLLFQAATG